MGGHAFSCAFSALTLLVGQQEGHLACKTTEWWGAGMVICLQRGADLHMAQLMPLPLTVSCFSKVKYTDIAKFAGHLPHRYGNSHAIWDHTVLPATRQR